MGRGGFVIVKSGVHIQSSWSDFKKYIDGTYKRLHLQFMESNSSYEIFAMDEDIVYSCILYKSGVPVVGIDANNDTDRSDFENNFKASGNKPIDKYVYLKDFGNLDPFNMRTMVRGFEIQVTTPTNPTIYSLSFAYDIWMLEGTFFGDWPEFHVDDKIDTYIVIQGDPTVSALTANANIGISILSVNDTSAILAGDMIELGATAEHYEVTAKTSTSLTISPALTQNKIAGNEIKLRLYRARDLHVIQNKIQDLGGSNFGSSKLPANYTLKIVYKHNTNPVSSFKIKFNMAYQYGKEL